MPCIIITGQVKHQNQDLQPILVDLSFTSIKQILSLREQCIKPLFLSSPYNHYPLTEVTKHAVLLESVLLPSWQENNKLLSNVKWSPYKSKKHKISSQGLIRHKNNTRLPLENDNARRTKGNKQDSAERKTLLTQKEKQKGATVKASN